MLGHSCHTQGAPQETLLLRAFGLAEISSELHCGLRSSYSALASLFPFTGGRPTSSLKAFFVCLTPAPSFCTGMAPTNPLVCLIPRWHPSGTYQRQTLSEELPGRAGGNHDRCSGRVSELMSSAAKPDSLTNHGVGLRGLVSLRRGLRNPRPSVTVL